MKDAPKRGKDGCWYYDTSFTVNGETTIIKNIRLKSSRCNIEPNKAKKALDILNRYEKRPLFEATKEGLNYIRYMNISHDKELLKTLYIRLKYRLKLYIKIAYYFVTRQ